MKKEIKTNKRTSAFASLKDFCIFSMGERKDKGDSLEVTEWANGEGYDIYITDVSGDKRFDLTYGQMEALKKCVKAINEENASKYNKVR